MHFCVPILMRLLIHSIHDSHHSPSAHSRVKQHHCQVGLGKAITQPSATDEAGKVRMDAHSCGRDARYPGWLGCHMAS